MVAEITIKMQGGKTNSIKLARWTSEKGPALTRGLGKSGQFLVGKLKKVLKGSNTGLIGRSPHKELRSRDGTLRASLNSQLVGGGKGLKVGTDKFYGKVHEYGATINITESMRKNSRFQITGGGWRRFSKTISQIKIPARPWFWPTVEKNHLGFMKIISDELFKPIRE